jgi:hypothetical protein
MGRGGCVRSIDCCYCIFGNQLTATILSILLNTVMDMKILVEKGILKEKKRSLAEEAAPPTYEVVHQPRACEDCGKIVTNRVCNTRKNNVPFPHYKTNCTACHLYRHPETGEFNLTNSAIQHYYRTKHK